MGSGWDGRLDDLACAGAGTGDADGAASGDLHGHGYLPSGRSRGSGRGVHFTAAVKAADGVYGVEPTPTAKKIRELFLNAHYVEDHCAALETVMLKGMAGETYCVGGDNEWENIRLVHALCDQVGRVLKVDPEQYRKLITFVSDRPGHDRRYAINCDKIKTSLGWKQSVNFETGIEKTIDWYLANQEWVKLVRSGDYQKWLDKNYEKR